MGGSGASLGDSGAVVEDPVLERAVTGRIVGSFLIDRGDDGVDLGERGVRGLSVDSGFKASALFDAGFCRPSLSSVVAVRSKFGTLFGFEGILGDVHTAERITEMKWSRLPPPKRIYCSVRCRLGCPRERKQKAFSLPMGGV